MQKKESLRPGANASAIEEELGQYIMLYFAVKEKNFIPHTLDTGGYSNTRGSVDEELNYWRLS